MKYFDKSHPDFISAIKFIMQNASSHKPIEKNMLKRFIKQLRKIDAIYPLSDYQDIPAVSNLYGKYYLTKPVLNITLNLKIMTLNTNEFCNLLNDAIEELHKIFPNIIFFSFLLPFKDDTQSPIFRILITGIKSKTLSKFLIDHEDIISLDNYSIQYMLFHMISKKLSEILEKLNYISTYPREIEYEELLTSDFNIDKYHIFQDLQSASKDLYQFKLIDEIGAKTESPIESRLSKSLVAQGIPHILQFDIVDSDYDEVFTTPDIYIPSEPQPIAIYADGAQFHRTKLAQTNDRRIDRRLYQLGYSVIRFSGSDIYSNIERVVEDVKCALFGRISQIFPEVFWVPKLEAILPTLVKEKEIVKDILYKIKQGKRITQKQENILNSILKKNKFPRTYDWLDKIEPIKE